MRVIVPDLAGDPRLPKGGGTGLTASPRQPWQKLAAVYEGNGQPADVRWMRYRSAVRSSRGTKGAQRGWARQAYRWTSGHGYYPLTALSWLVVIFGLAGV